MSKRGLQNEEFIQKIRRDGSTALKPKNQIGINVVDESVSDSGVISGKLNRPKYNEEELLKSIDTTIVELLPRERPVLPDTVLRSVYNEATQSINELTLDVEELETQVGSLNSKIESLHATTESLRRDLDGVNLAKSISDNQLFASQDAFVEAQRDLQIAIQNGTQEAIARVSLVARNESLQQEIDLLREQLFGQTSQVSAGAEVLNELVTVRNLSAQPGPVDIYATALKDSNNGDTPGKVTWVSGQKFEISNNGTESVTVQISNVWPITQKAFTSDEDDVKWYNLPSSIAVGAGEQKTVTLTQGTDQLTTVSDVRPTGYGATRNYDGSITFKIGTDEIKFNTRLRKAQKATKL
jgi:prefoldin subunit 5